MILTPLDWVVIALYFALSLVVGLVYTRRAGESAEEYFLSDLLVGRPWRGWLGIVVALLLTAWVVRGAEAAEIE